MKLTEFGKTLLFYGGAVPAANHLINHPLAQRGLEKGTQIIENMSGLETITEVALATAGIAVLEGSRRGLKKLGKKRKLSNSSLSDKVRLGSYSLGKQITGVVAGIVGVAVGTALIDQSILGSVTDAMTNYGKDALEFMYNSGNDLVQGLYLGATATGITIVASVANAMPFRTKKKEGNRVYEMEIYNKHLSKTPLTNYNKFRKTFTPFFLPKNLLRFSNPNTVFAGKITSTYDGEEKTWWITYNEKGREGNPDLVKPEDVRNYIGGIAKIQKKKHANPDFTPNLTYDDVKDFIRRNLKGKVIDRNIFGESMSKEKIYSITMALANSEYENVMTLDVDKMGNEGPEVYEERIEDLVGHANIQRIDQGGNYELVVHEIGNLAREVLTYSINTNKSLDGLRNKGADFSPSDIKFHVNLYGGAGTMSDHHGDDHDDGHDDHGEEVFDIDFDTHGQGHSATIKDRIEPLKKTGGQISYGFGTLEQIQVGKAYVIDEVRWKSTKKLGFGKVYNIEDENEKVIAQAYNKVSDLGLRILNKFGIGKEYVTHEAIDPKDDIEKLALSVLCHMYMRSEQPAVERSLMQKAKSLQANYQQGNF